jgi:transposase
MPELPDLKQLAPEAKDALILSLWEEIQRLRKVVEKRPQKTSKNSSLPPSKGFKPSVQAKPRPTLHRTASEGRAGGGRRLSEHPDQLIQARVQICQSCGGLLSSERQQLIERYDKIEIQPNRPIVTQVERYGCNCPTCGTVQLAPVPAQLSPGSPYGNSIAALVTTLRYSHAISYARIKQLMSEIFDLKISEGAIANLLLRVKQQLQTTVHGIWARLHQSRIIGSDETSARVNGTNQWEWTFQTQEVCLHVIRPSRGAEVIEEVLGGHRPAVWISDLYSAQKKHPAQQWQVCLAHQLRDCQYGIDAGDQVFSPRMKRILLWAIALHRRGETLSQESVK